MRFFLLLKFVKSVIVVVFEVLIFLMFAKPVIAGVGEVLYS